MTKAEWDEIESRLPPLPTVITKRFWAERLSEYRYFYLGNNGYVVAYSEFDAQCQVAKMHPKARVCLDIRVYWIRDIPIKISK